MKIVMIGTAYPMRGGIAQFNAILAKALAERHEVEFLSFRRQYPGLLFPGKTQFVTPEDEATAVRVNATPMLDSIDPFSWWRTARHAARGAPNLVLLKYWLPFLAPCLGSVTRWIKRRADARIIYVCDNVIPHERTLLDLPLTRYALAAGDAFVVMSTAVRDDLLRVRPDARWRLVHHPIYDVFGPRIAKPVARAALALPAGPLALFFGYVRPYKGLDLLLRALPIIRRRIPLRVVVAGEFYEGEARYRRLADELGVADAVRFDADYIAQDRVATYFSASDLVVLPYRTATQSGIIQVAYHLDTPVICTDVGGLGEIVHEGRTGLLVPPDDVEALAAAVVRYYDEQLEEPLRAGVAEAKQDFSWAPLVAAIEELADPGASSPAGRAG
jgi:glycosyltransferase involved in cell wall biosynthesis